MKIIKKESKYFYYKPDKYCCKKMKKWLDVNEALIMKGNKIYITSSLYDEISINYCPFCGEKIE